MPYTNLKEVPKSYLTETKKDKKIFMDVFNKAYKRLKKQKKKGKDLESAAHSIAFGVLRKRHGLGPSKEWQEKQKKRKKKSFINRLRKIAFILATQVVE